MKSLQLIAHPDIKQQIGYTASSDEFAAVAEGTSSYANVTAIFGARMLQVNGQHRAAESNHSTQLQQCHPHEPLSSSYGLW